MGVLRRITQIAAATDGEAGEFWPVLFALADDGTVWRRDGVKGWQQVEPDGLPEAESCGATDPKEPPRDRPARCRLARGHREQHWSGERRWT